MNDADAAIQKERVQRYLDKWMPAGFGWWKIKLEWDRGDHADCDTYERAAHINEQWEYRQAKICFHLSKLKDESDEGVERIVVHELSHLLVGSVRDYSTDAQRQMTEFAVSCVTNALLWTHQNVK